MKRLKLTHIFVLFISLALIGCGSDSEKAPDSLTENAPNNSSIDGDTIENINSQYIGEVKAVSSFNEFVDEVMDGNFQDPAVYYGDHEGNVFNGGEINEGLIVEVFFTQVECEETSFLGIKGQSCSGSTLYSRKFSNFDQVESSPGFSSDIAGESLISLKAALVDKLLDAENVYKCFYNNCYEESTYPNAEATRFAVEVNDRVYEIDTSLPLMVNPIGIYDSKEETNIFFNPQIPAQLDQ